MRGILLTALVAAGVLADGSLGNRAAAMMPTGAAALYAAGARAALVHEAAAVCGSNGCAVVQTKRVQHHKASTIATKH